MNDKYWKYQWDVQNPTGYNNKMGQYKTKKEFDFIKNNIGNNKKLKIIDIGGGSGRFANPLNKEGYDITVIDQSPEAIDLCKQRGINKSYCINLVDFNESGYDIALAIELFLVTKPEVVINETKRLLKNNGILILIGANTNSWRFKLRNLRKKKSRSLDLSYKEYTNVLLKYSFELLSIKGFNWMPFKVNSNNILIPFFDKLEKLFRLDKWLSQSPYLMIAAKKKNERV